MKLEKLRDSKETAQFSGKTCIFEWAKCTKNQPELGFRVFAKFGQYLLQETIKNKRFYYCFLFSCANCVSGNIQVNKLCSKMPWFSLFARFDDHQHIWKDLVDVLDFLHGDIHCKKGSACLAQTYLHLFEVFNHRESKITCKCFYQQSV